MAFGYLWQFLIAAKRFDSISSAVADEAQKIVKAAIHVASVTHK